MIKDFTELLKVAKQRGPKTVAVACAEDVEVLKAVKNAYEAGVVKAILVGNEELIRKYSFEIEMDLGNYEVVDKGTMKEASMTAVELVSSGKADMVMKGLVDTSIILKAVLDKDIGLRTGNVLSHVAVFDLEHYHKLLFVTDAAMNIAPDLNQKKQIIENSLVVVKAIDVDEPKVAVVCAKEKVNEKMPCTVDAGKLAEMNVNGAISDCIVGGPFALDNAVSKEAAEVKGIDHPVAGDADVILCPNIESGNILYKSLNFLADAKSAGIIVGAKAPIVLTSRADSEEAKLNSIALGTLMAANK